MDSSDSSRANSVDSGEGYIVDCSEGGNSTDSSNVSMTSNISMTSNSTDAGDYSPILTPSPTPYNVYNLQSESHNLPEEVLNKSKFEWLYFEDVAHLCNFPSGLILTKQPIKVYQGLYLFEKWMTPDEYNWDSISELRCTRELNRLYYTVARKNIGPFVGNVRTTSYRRIYQLVGSLKSEYVLVDYKVSFLDDSVPSCDDSSISTILLDSENSNGDHTSDADFIGEGF